MGLKELVREKAAELGLVPVGFTGAHPLREARAYLTAQAAAGKNTPFVSADVPLRTDPRRVWPQARSILMVGLPYAVAPAPRPRGLTGYLASGCAGPDYHRVLGEKLKELAVWLEREVPGSSYHLFVDTGLLVERALAWRAGLGVWGENTHLLTPGGGAAFFLGGLLTDVSLEPDEPQQGTCLSCGRCRKACPTGALTDPFHLDATRCLSYLTQAKGDIPRPLRPHFGNRLYGCDTCLNACPLIKKAPVAGAEVDLAEFMFLGRREFAARYGSTAAGWRGRTVLQRNAAFALGNLADPAGVPLLERLLADPRPPLRAAAAWSLGQIGDAGSRAALAQQLRRETEPQVRLEISLALSG